MYVSVIRAARWKRFTDLVAGNEKSYELIPDVLGIKTLTYNKELLDEHQSSCLPSEN